MNQAASATRRAPTDSAASVGGCCPMLNASFFGPQTPTATAQCFLNPQAQLFQLARQQQQQSNVVLSPQQQTVSQSSTLLGQQQQLQAQQPTAQRSHSHTSNHYSTSLTAHNLSLNPQAALAMALASCFPQIPLFAPQNHQLTPINQPTQSVAPPPLPTTTVTQPSAPQTFTTQVPLTNFNSYPPPTQPYINSTRHAGPQAAPPVAPHQQQQQSTGISSNILSTNLNTAPQTAPTSNGANNQHQNVQQPRPLVTNTALSSSTNQLADSIYRNSQHQPTDHASNAQQQQASSTPSPAQHLGQATRNILSDDTLNTNNPHIQMLMLQQIFADQQTAPPPPLSGPQIQLQQISTPQQIINTTSRTQTTTLPLSGQLPVVMTPAQQVTSTQIAPPQHHRPSEQVSEIQQQQQQAFQQSPTQSRTNHTPPQQQPLSNDTYQALIGTATGDSYLSQPNNDMHIRRSPADQLMQAHQSPQVPMQLQPPQHPPPPANLGLQFYPYQDTRLIEQVLTMISNPQLASNIFRQIVSIAQNGGIRLEPHQQFPVHHYHQHLHGTHHHHHGQNGPANGQDASMPLDSLAINESKPRGLSRAEIDSLTPYMHTNEKDARSCVICLSKFELKAKIRPLPCNHAFHAKCVDKWLRTNRTCPICRRDALKTFNGKIKRI